MGKGDCTLVGLTRRSVKGRREHPAITGPLLDATACLRHSLLAANISDEIEKPPGTLMGWDNLNRDLKRGTAQKITGFNIE